MKIYGVFVTRDYENGGVVNVFSTYEKAKEYADSIKLSILDGIDIITMVVDMPNSIGETDYQRHG
jgi:hypothetical protein